MDAPGSQPALLALAVIVWTSLVALVAVFLRLTLRGWSRRGRRRS